MTMCSSSQLLPQFISLFLLLISTQIDCLNVDTRYPVAFRYPGRSSSLGSPHFGHSVLVLRKDGDQSPDSTIFLIGAPNESGIERNGSGAVYRCEWREKQDRTSCYRVQINFDYRSGPTSGMHLGSNLLAQRKSSSSQTSPNYISCAFARSSQHNIFRPSLNRYEMNYNPNGACYQLAVDRARPLSTLMPADDGAQQFKSHNSTTSVYYYSHAMAGFSAAFAENGSRLLLGAPGFDNWRGALMSVPESADGVRLQGERAVIEGRVDEEKNSERNSALAEEFAYLGYSLAIGRFFGDKEVAAVGAPRVDFQGSVAFFSLHKSGKGQQQPPFYEVKGSQSGEYFGASLLALDLNGDGLDDLLVGAPMYCSPAKKDVSDEGRVRVFLSTGTRLALRQTLLGSAVSDGRFGTAMALAGDLNHDGFADVVIGAPYEEGGQGAVYLYRGGPQGLLLSGNYSQRIGASSLPSSLSLGGFGFSFSASPLDVDGNGFSDLLVGAYLSDSALLLRARPLIGLSAAIHLSNESIDLSSRCAAQLQSSSTACLTLQLCFNTANFEAGNRVRLRTTLVVDALMNDRSQRCHILLNGQQRSTEVVDTVDLSRSPVPICSPRPYLVVMEEQAKIDNYIDPVLFSMRYQLDTGESGSLSRENIYSVPVVEGATVNITREAFLRACGRKAAKDCLSTLQLRPFVTLLEEGEEGGEEREAVGAIELIEGLHRKVRLQLVVVNVGEPAFAVKVNLTMGGEQLSLISLDSRCTFLENGNVLSNQSVIECTLSSGPLTDRASVELTFAPFSSYGEVSCSVQVSAANRVDSGASHLVEHFSLRRVKRAGISLKVQQSPPIRYKSGAHNASFSSLLTLERLNYSTIDLLELTFLYPASAAGRPILTRPMHIKNLNDRIPLRCDPEKDYNLQQEPTEELGRLWSKSAVEQRRIKGEFPALSLNCDPASMSGPLRLQCKAIRCELGPMSWQALSAYVHFSSALLVGTVEEAFGEDDQLAEMSYSVQLRASIIDEHLEWAGGTAPVSSLATLQLTFKSVESVSDEPVSWWIYLVAVLIGLLLIALLVLILCKCGFFKRKGAAHLAAQEEEEE